LRKTHGNADVKCHALSKDWWGNYDTRWIQYTNGGSGRHVTVFINKNCTGGSWGVVPGWNYVNPVKNFKAYQIWSD
jgi:hypothetical protein